MPLRGSVGDMISEIMHSYKKKHKIGNARPKSSKKAHKMAIAIALGRAEKKK